MRLGFMSSRKPTVRRLESRKARAAPAIIEAFESRMLLSASGSLAADYLGQGGARGGVHANAVIPLSSITLTKASLVDANDHAVTKLDKGEEVFIEADWATKNLSSSASYRISYNVDGVVLETNTLTYGAGQASGTWFWYLGGWFASPGLHHVTVSIDPARISTSSKSFTFTPVTAPDLPHKFISPLGGSQTTTWGIVNYVDVDPLANQFKDYQGGNYTYDGHAGHDMSLANFGSMDAGVPDIAAAAGTVVTVHDGNFDRNTSFNSSAQANYVDIDMGNGWHEIYYHFRMNTILVHVGQKVVAGQVLGLAGSSGYSTGSHLHFEVQHNGDVVETEYDPTTYWSVTQTPQKNIATVVDSGVSGAQATTVNDLNAEERPVNGNTFSQKSGQQLTEWIIAYTRANDAIKFKFYKPDGTLYSPLGSSFTASESRGGYWYSYWNLPASMAIGTWHVKVFINGVQLASDPFYISAKGAGALHVSRGSTYVENGRTTPIDFGTVAKGSSAPKLSFMLSNIGSNTLSISKITLPAGFSIFGAAPTSIAVGASATLTLQMSTATAGIRAGIVTITSNDPRAGSYRFDIKGTVSGASAGAIHGQVFQDNNKDAIEQASDFGLFGWTVSLLNARNVVVATTTTGFNGYYDFYNLAAGSYHVVVTLQSGYSQTTSKVVTPIAVSSSDLLASPIGVMKV